MSLSRATSYNKTLKREIIFNNFFLSRSEAFYAALFMTGPLSDDINNCFVQKSRSIPLMYKITQEVLFYLLSIDRSK